MLSGTKRMRATGAQAMYGSDGEAEPNTGHAHAHGTGAAERKRELERNRRNLVNTRFAELENQLARLPGAPKRVYRRIDKEVVLKDATQALASQQRDLELANSRLASMSAEIGTLRSEKLELRHDKAYLHKELATARGENKTLAADNMLLWHALRKSGALKNVVPANLSKVPVSVVLGVEDPPVLDSSRQASGGRPQLSNFGSANDESSLKQHSTENTLTSHPSTVGCDMFDNFGIDLDIGAQQSSSSPNASISVQPSIESLNVNAGIHEEFLKLSQGFNGVVPNSSAVLSQFGAEGASQQHTSDGNGAHPDIPPCG